MRQIRKMAKDSARRTREVRSRSDSGDSVVFGHARCTSVFVNHRSVAATAIGGRTEVRTVVVFCFVIVVLALCHNAYVAFASAGWFR